MVLLWIMLSLLVACESKKEPGRSEVEAKDSSRYPKPDVIARVNGKEITKEYFLKALDQAKRETPFSLMPSTGGQSQEKISMEERVLERLIELELLSQKADELGLGPSQEELAERLALVTGGLEKDELQKRLGDLGISENEYLGDVERSLKIEKLIEVEIRSKIRIDEQEMRAFYESHLSRFKAPESRRLRHIFVKAPQGDLDEKKKEAFVRIEKALKRIKSGEHFAKVAREVSEDFTAANGGSLGNVTKGQLLPELEEKVFSLKTGEVSDILESPLGYHIFKVEGRKAALDVPFEKARRRIEVILRTQKEEEGLREYVRSLRERATIEKFLTSIGS